MTVSLLMSVAGCGDSQTEATATTTTAAPTTTVAPTATTTVPTTTTTKPVDAAATEVTFTQPDNVSVADPLNLQWKFWDWYEAEQTASDPRVSGTTLTGVLSDPDFEKGLVEITNDSGMWRGMFTGIHDATTSTYYLEGLLLGTGDYEGLQFRMYWEGDGIDFAGNGTIESIAWPLSD